MIINANNTVKWMNNLHKRKIPLLPKIIYLFNRVIYACDIRPNNQIDPSVLFPHNALGVVVHHNSVIKKNTKILHHVTIGGSLDKKRIINGKEVDSPIIGSNVLIGVGSVLIGPIEVGDNSIIGAGAIVTKDVPANTIVYGVGAINTKENHY